MATSWAALCRGVTGDGLVRRRLYSDDQLSVLSFCRAIMLTAIDPGALRGDLSERLLPVALERITPDRRRLDDDLTAAWADAHPRLLGALLTLTSAVLAALPAVRLPSLPRMADFARVVAGVDQVLGTAALPAYLNLGTALAAEVIDAEPVASTIRDHLAR